MILLIDNYDSFAHNLARYVRLLGHDVEIRRNDALTPDEAGRLAPSAIILSPGPCAPTQAGISTGLVRSYGDRIPILGVCLGHQCINEAYGGATIRAPAPVHGRASTLTHSGGKLFDGLPATFRVGRYHSLMTFLPPDSQLQVTATSEDDIIMSLSHRIHPVHGVQFHPESILTEHGFSILENFLKDRA